MAKIIQRNILKNSKEDYFLENLLRPGKWNDYIGQEMVKNNLQIMIKAAKKRGELPDHLLFYGPQGLGKTTLAHLIAKEAGANLRVISGVNLERAGDLAAVLANLESGDLLFIDEAHRLNRLIEEMLYPAMEMRKLYLTVGKGPAARMMTLDLPPFTLVAATTRLNLLSAPLRSRFGAVFGLNYYALPEMESIILRSAEILKINLDKEAVSAIAQASRFTPRIANRLLRRLRDYAEVNNLNLISEETAESVLKMLDIDKLGLEKGDRQILEIIIKRFKGGPVGLNTLAAMTGEDGAIIEEIYEPFLIRLGFLQRTSAGRRATEDARRHLQEG